MKFYANLRALRKNKVNEIYVRECRWSNVITVCMSLISSESQKRFAMSRVFIRMISAVRALTSGAISVAHEDSDMQIKLLACIKN